MGDTKYPKRLKRSESFLGIHFDFHASDDCTEIGKNVTPEMVEKIVQEVKPDYIQCDCKGHRGLSSYMTNVGNRAPGFVRDQLRIWREVTAKNGVSLYLHYSGVWDTEAVKKHPTWARITEKGEIDKNNTSTFGPYADELLIPQLKELCDDYGVDGVWVDGECWATCQDYGEGVIRAFQDETGIKDIPKGPEDPYFYEFTQFCREGFRRYLRHYINELHKHNKSFQIASNWAFTSFMPEPVTADVDFISGDYSMQNSINAARLEGRCMTRQGKPWDLMAWSFSSKWEERYRSTKSIPQLQQEAAIVLALGGGFQAYFTQKRDGSISGWQMKLMGQTAKFCRDRQRVCHRAEAVPQIALLNSSESFYRRNPRLFSPWSGQLQPLQGTLQALLESQQSVEILSEHHLSGRMGEYPIVILPECENLKPEFKDELLEYVKDGGNLLVIGPKTAALFKDELGIAFTEELQTGSGFWLGYDGWLAGMQTTFRKVSLNEGVQPVGKLYYENDDIGPSNAAASIAEFGKGKIAGIYFNYGERYLNGATATARKFLNGVVRELFPKPMVEVSGSHYVDLTVNRLEGKLAVNLVNTAGPHANTQVYVYDEVPPIGPLEVVIRTCNKPSKVVFEPAGTELPFDFADGEVRLTLPKLEIHGVIMVE